MKRRSVWRPLGTFLFAVFFVGGSVTAHAQSSDVQTIPSSQTASPAPAQPASSAADWKGEPYLSQMMFSGLTGLAIIDNHTTFTVLGSAAKKILDQGFVPDINDSVWVEAEIGPAFYAGNAALVYSVHLRWDFNQNQNWTFYALAGFAGNVTPAALGGHDEFFPRVGLGAVFHLIENLSIRGELSHEFIVAGVQFEF